MISPGDHSRTLKATSKLWHILLFVLQLTILKLFDLRFCIVLAQCCSVGDLGQHHGSCGQFLFSTTTPCKSYFRNFFPCISSFSSFLNLVFSILSRFLFHDCQKCHLSIVLPTIATQSTQFNPHLDHCWIACIYLLVFDTPISKFTQTQSQRYDRIE